MYVQLPVDTHRLYPSHHNCSPSMLHCVMESETPCAALVLALNAGRVALKTSLIYETAIKSQRNFPAGAPRVSAAGYWLSWLVVSWGWVAAHLSLLGAATIALPFHRFPLTFVKCFTPLLDCNTDHMCCMFTKHGGFNQNLAHFYPNCLHGVICLHTQVQLLFNSYTFASV